MSVLYCTPLKLFDTESRMQSIACIEMESTFSLEDGGAGEGVAGARRQKAHARMMAGSAMTHATYRAVRGSHVDTATTWS